MTVFDDLSAEQERLAGILGGLDDAQWLSASGAAGWTIADVVLHLAQSEESVVVTASGGELRARMGQAAGGTVDERVASLVRAERAAPTWCSSGGSGPGGRHWTRCGPPTRTGRWLGGRAGQARHAGDDPAGRALGARPGHHRAARATSLTPSGCGTWPGLLTGPAVRDDAGRAARRAGPVRADRAGRRVGVGVWPGGSAESGIAGPAGDFCRVAARGWPASSHSRPPGRTASRRCG